MHTFINKNTGKLHINFQISILIMITAVLFVSSLSVLFSVLSVNRQAGIETAEQFFENTAAMIEHRLDDQMNEALRTGDLMRTLQVFDSPIDGDGTDYPGLLFMIEVLHSEPYLYSVYAGKTTGDFIQVIRTSGDRGILDMHNAPDDTSYILRLITGADSDRVQKWYFLDENRLKLAERIETLPEYNPSFRPWFEQAQKNPGETLLTSPYVFNSLRRPGLTASAAIPGNKTVIGIDMTLDGIKKIVDGIIASERTGILILDDQNRILASNSWFNRTLGIPDVPLVPLSEVDIDKYNLMLKDNSLLNREILWDLKGGNKYKLVISAPVEDFMGQQGKIRQNIILITLAVVVLIFPLVLIISRSFGRFLKLLAEDAEKIQELDYSGKLPGHSMISEFNELSGAFRVMKRSLSERTAALAGAKGKLENIIDLGIAMSVEKDSNKLFELILKGAKQISHADGGSLYIKTDEDVLDFMIVLNDTLGFEQGGTQGGEITLPGVPMFAADGTPNYHNVVSYACHKCETVVIDDAYEVKDFDFSGTRKFDEMNNYRSKSFLTIPLKLPGSDVMGAIQLLNCKDVSTGETIPFGSDIQRFVEALSAEAAAILYNRNLLKAQEQLFESLIQLIATSIDTKSPYTGGHCYRVPVLAMMLAEEAENSGAEGLADFKFRDADEKRAFRIGAWLHDAGKITTPEFVVDKSVKLETIYNRIHEIRTRFEVLLRDIWIEEKDALLSGEDVDAVSERRRKKEQELFAEYAFVASCNTGEYNPEPDWTDRLSRIGAKTWYGYFDHTLGLSTDEEKALQTPYKAGQPVENFLLADKAEHIVPHLNDRRKIYDDFDFKLIQPEHLYNRGELYNLSIPRGTLTDEERFKINEHIMQTIVMLENLPMPKGLERITDFAGSHHETLDGKGYPRKLSSEQLSIPSRVLAIADIFEALTASDRPYKKAKTLTEAISIMKGMKERRHIDEPLFRLFLESGIYLEYAGMYLKEEQIDEVDINLYLD